MGTPRFVPHPTPTVPGAECGMNRSVPLLGWLETGSFQPMLGASRRFLRESAAAPRAPGMQIGDVPSACTFARRGRPFGARLHEPPYPRGITGTNMNYLRGAGLVTQNGPFGTPTLLQPPLACQTVRSVSSAPLRPSRKTRNLPVYARWADRTAKPQERGGHYISKLNLVSTREV